MMKLEQLWFVLILLFAATANAQVPEALPATEDAQEIKALTQPLLHYPDHVIAVIFDASKHPEQIALAARYLRDPSSIASAPRFNDSILALMQYPTLLEQLVTDLVWVNDLGQRVVSNEPALWASVESRRLDAGNVSDPISVTRTKQQIVYRSAPSVILRTDPLARRGFARSWVYPSSHTNLHGHRQSKHHRHSTRHLRRHGFTGHSRLHYQTHWNSFNPWGRYNHYPNRDHFLYRQQRQLERQIRRESKVRQRDNPRDRPHHNQRGHQDPPQGHRLNHRPDSSDKERPKNAKPHTTTESARAERKQRPPRPYMSGGGQLR